MIPTRLFCLISLLFPLATYAAAPINFKNIASTNSVKASDITLIDSDLGGGNYATRTATLTVVKPALGISTNLTDSGTNVLAQGGVLASALVSTNAMIVGSLWDLTIHNIGQFGPDASTNTIQMINEHYLNAGTANGYIRLDNGYGYPLSMSNYCNFNIFIGVDVLLHGTVDGGTDLTFIGDDIGANGTFSGSTDLIGIGDGPLAYASMVSSSYNIAIGSGALDHAALTNSNDNIAIGDNAGRFLTGTVANSVMIGANTTSTNSNDFVLGNSSHNYFFPGASMRVEGPISAGQSVVTPLLSASSAVVGSMAVVRTALTHAGTVTLDFSNTNRYTTLSLTGDVTFATANLAAGKWYNVIVTMTSTNDTPTFPAWKWLGGAPSTLTGNQIGVLSLYPTSTTDATTLAAYTETQ